ncbi:hypothetical protein Tco_1427732 [Tanacetum coccineum]
MKELADQLQELSDKGFIRPSSSPWGALFYSSRRKMDRYEWALEYSGTKQTTVITIEGSRGGKNPRRLPQNSIWTFYEFQVIPFVLTKPPASKQEHEGTLEDNIRVVEEREFQNESVYKVGHLLRHHGDVKQKLCMGTNSGLPEGSADFYRYTAMLRSRVWQLCYCTGKEVLRMKKLEPRTDGTLCINGAVVEKMLSSVRSYFGAQYEKLISPPMLAVLEPLLRSRPTSEAIGQKCSLMSVSRSDFEVRDKVMLKVSPWKGVVHFGKRGKLNPRFVGPFKVIKKVGDVAYKLELPEELSRFVEEPIEISNRKVKRLKRSRIPLVKVRWNSKRGPEFTWEREDQFRKKYPHLFSKTGPSSSAAS